MNNNNEPIKQKLKSAWFCQKQLEADLQKLQDLKDLAVQITPAYGASSHCSGASDKIGGTVVKITDVEVSIQNDIKELTEALTEIRTLIKQVDDGRLRLILYKRYMNYERWEKIAMDLGYSWKQIHRLHSRALSELIKDDIE